MPSAWLQNEDATCSLNCWSGVQRQAAAVSHHLLGAYQRSLVEVIRAQLGPKAAPGGLAVRLCRQSLGRLANAASLQH